MRHLDKICGFVHHRWIFPPFVDFSTIRGFFHHPWIFPPFVDFSTIRGFDHRWWIFFSRPQRSALFRGIRSVHGSGLWLRAATSLCVAIGAPDLAQ